LKAHVLNINNPLQHDNKYSVLYYQAPRELLISPVILQVLGNLSRINERRQCQFHSAYIPTATALA